MCVSHKVMCLVICVTASMLASCGRANAVHVLVSVPDGQCVCAGCCMCQHRHERHEASSCSQLHALVQASSAPADSCSAGLPESSWIIRMLGNLSSILAPRWALYFVFETPGVMYSTFLLCVLRVR